MPLEVGVQVPLGWVAAVGVRIIPPIVEFGSAVQRAKAEEPNKSYWHIPITIKPGIFGIIGPATLKPCRVYMDRYSGESISAKIQLAWGDMAFEEPRREEILQRNRVLLAPIVWRVEGSDELSAIVADLRWHKAGLKQTKIPGNREKNRFKLRIKCGNQEWVSKNFYFIRVPHVDSNSQFSLEIEFEGEGTQGA